MFLTRDREQAAHITAGEFDRRVGEVARGLVRAGVEQGDRVGLLSSTRLEWALLDFAIWYVGAVSVPIYDSSSEEQIQWILDDSRAVGCVVETTDHLRLVQSVRPHLPQLARVWTIDQAPAMPVDEAPSTGVRALSALATDGTAADLAEIERRREHLDTDDVATIIYTSGTTGRPKGCELTHRNLLSETRAATDVLSSIYDVERGDSTVLFLPLAHVFARVIQLVCINARVPLAHSGSITTLLDDLALYRPRFVLGVPRVFEKVHDGAAARAGSSRLGSRMFAAASATAVAWSRAQSAPDTLPIGLRLRHAFFTPLVYRRLRGLLGGKARYAISGGAALSDHLAHFYRGVGITVLEGYGLTETTAAITLNPPEAVRIGTVGRVLPGNQVRIASDGEVEVAGPVVFQRYRGHEPRAGNWFSTGDIGTIDAEGYLSIVGRKKEMLVTAGGKNVYPGPWEDRVASHPLIDHSMVVGDGERYIAALITLDHEACAHWLARNGHPGTEQPWASQEVRAAIAEAVEAANRSVSRAESVRAFDILSSRWTVEGGELTPSMKLKRSHVAQEYREHIDALYGH